MALGGIGAFLTQRIGPVPMWVIVGAGGVGVAFFAPKLLSKFGGSNASASPTDTGAPTNGGTSGGSSGGNTNPPTPPPSPAPPAKPRGPAQPVARPVGPLRKMPPQPVGFEPGGPIEPTGPSGPAQPVAHPPTREPSGGGSGFHRMPPQPAPEPTPPGETPTGGRLPPEPVHPAAGRPKLPPQPVEKPPQYIHPMAWPANGSTLSEIAALHGITLQRLEDLNGWIYKDRGTWNAIYPGDEIRIS